MFSESGSSFCFVGVSSNSKVFLSEKDLKGNNNNSSSNNMGEEVGLFVRPNTMEKIHKEECQILTQQDHHHHQLIKLQHLSVQEQGDNKDHHQHHHDHQEKQVTKPLNLKIEIRSNHDDDEDCTNEGLKTPTSSDHKIPVILECPGAPKKTKTRPVTKRKASRRRIVLDLSQDLESLFPVPYGFNNKRVKHCSEKGMH